MFTTRPASDADTQHLLVFVRTLFSGVHGIVVVSLEDRFIGLAPIDVESELLIMSTPSWPASKVRVEQSGWL